MHSIEHRIERSEKTIVQDRKIIDKNELRIARNGDGRRHREIKLQTKGEEAIENMLIKMGTRVHRAPNGMKRRKENNTSWSKNQRIISWQVEWIREGDAARVLHKMPGSRSVGVVYDEWREEERRRNMNEAEIKADKKRKADEVKVRQKKRARMERETRLDITSPKKPLQDAETGAWSISPTSPQRSNSPEGKDPALPAPRKYNDFLYLHRPLTPSSYPKVLVPINPAKTLTEILRRRELMEYPTIYVFEKGPENLPHEFMLEKDFLTAIGQAPPVENEDTDMGDGSEEPDDDDDTSSSGSDDDEDEEMEDGEIIG